MIPHPKDCFASNQAPQRVTPEDSFSRDREVIFDQACRVDLANLGLSPAGCTRWFLIFTRWCHILAPEGFYQSENGIRWGVEIAAYACDEHGTVRDWDRRYEMTGLDFEHAGVKLRFQLQNDLAVLSNSECESAPSLSDDD